MGENAAKWIGIAPDKIAYWPAGPDSIQFSIHHSQNTREQFDRAELILFSSHCGVHSYYQPEMVHYWQAKNHFVIVHPECQNKVVTAANAWGSTAFIWDFVTQDRANTKRYAIATENHMVQNLKEHCARIGIDVVNVADTPVNLLYSGRGCGCATMSRNDPPHLVALLDLLRQDKQMDYNHVLPGDVVNEASGQRQRLNPEQQRWICENARKAMENMIRIVESEN